MGTLHPYKIDEKGRINFKSCAKKHIKDFSKYMILLMGNHLTIIESESFEKQAQLLADEIKRDKKDVALYLADRSRHLSVDNQGRLHFTSQEQSAIFKNDDEVLIIPLKIDGIKSLEIYSRHVYENLMAGIDKDISDAIENKYKGKDNEEGRRKD